MKRRKPSSRPNDDSRVCPRRRGPQQGQEYAGQAHSSFHGFPLRFARCLPSFASPRLASFISRIPCPTRSNKSRMPMDLPPPNSFTPLGTNLLLSAAYRVGSISRFPIECAIILRTDPRRRTPSEANRWGGSCEGQSGSSLLVRFKIGRKNRRKSLQNGFG